MTVLREVAQLVLDLGGAVKPDPEGPLSDVKGLVVHWAGQVFHMADAGHAVLLSYHMSVEEERAETIAELEGVARHEFMDGLQAELTEGPINGVIVRSQDGDGRTIGGVVLERFVFFDPENKQTAKNLLDTMAYLRNKASRVSRLLGGAAAASEMQQAMMSRAAADPDDIAVG